MIQLVEWCSMMHWDGWAEINLSVETMERARENKGETAKFSPKCMGSIWWEAYCMNMIMWTVSVKTWVLFPVKFYFILNLSETKMLLVSGICRSMVFSLWFFGSSCETMAYFWKVKEIVLLPLDAWLLSTNSCLDNNFLEFFNLREAEITDVDPFQSLPSSF